MASIICEVCRVTVLGSVGGRDDRYDGACEACVPIPGISDDRRVAEHLDNERRSRAEPVDEVAVLRAQVAELTTRLAAVESKR